jgi:hypothetical protein
MNTEGTDTRDEFVKAMLEPLDGPPVSEEFLERLRRRVEDSPRRTWSRRFQTLPVRLAIATTWGLLCVGGGAFVGVSVSSAKPTPPHKRAAQQPSPVLTFNPNRGWNTMDTAVNTPALPNNNEVAWAANVPFAPEDSMTGWPTNTIRSLPANGIVVFASLARYQTDTPNLFSDQTLPLSLADGEFHSSGYETQPAPNVSADVLYAHVKSQYLLVIVWYGSNTPGSAITTAAQQELNALRVPDAPAQG